MANMFDWNALEQKIAGLLAEHDDLSRTKALTALALSEILEISVEEAIDAITDGGHDRGVDALYIDDREGRNDIHIVQTKCVEEFDRSKKNFPGSEVDKLISFIVDLTNHDSEALDKANPLLKAKIQDAFEALRQANSSVTVHFVGNLLSLIEDERNRIAVAFAKYKAIHIEHHDLDSISDFFLEKKAPALVREISVIDTNFFERADQNVRAIVCSVAATDIVDAIRSSENRDEIEIGIFDQNVRVYLKRNNRINRRIIESALEDENHMFWYRNNGITITCDKMEIGPSKRSPKIKLHNVQIVNGGQTSNCLFEAANQDREKVENVLVLVRIIETTSSEVKLSIAETTNSQTPINVRDLRSNDRQQRQLEEAFDDLGYAYERKNGQHRDKPLAVRVDALDAGQAYLAYGIGLPETAKKDRGRVFGDLYETVFSEDITAPKLLVSFQLLALVNGRKAEVRRRIRDGEALGRGEMSLIDGAFHVLFAMRQIVVREGRDTWDFEEVSAYLDEALRIVGDLYAAEQEKDPNFSSNRYFKDAKTKDDVTRSVG